MSNQPWVPGMFLADVAFPGAPCCSARMLYHYTDPAYISAYGGGITFKQLRAMLVMLDTVQRTDQILKRLETTR